MKTSILRWSAFTLAAATWAFLASGCVMADGGYGYGDAGYVGADYYEPVGVEYGGWGPGYHVAPFRGDHHRDGGEHRGPGEHGPGGAGGHPGGHTFRSAPASRAMPSLPSHGRAGGSGPRR